jgi:hypothetical protein
VEQNQLLEKVKQNHLFHFFKKMKQNSKTKRKHHKKKIKAFAPLFLKVDKVERI